MERPPRNDNEARRREKDRRDRAIADLKGKTNRVPVARDPNYTAPVPPPAPMAPRVRPNTPAQSLTTDPIPGVTRYPKKGNE